MAKSYKRGWVKHAPLNKHGNVRWIKVQANRKVRHAKDVPDGKTYRRYTNPWDIHDYRSRIRDPIAHAKQDNCPCLFDEARLNEEIKEWEKKYFKKNGQIYKRA